MNTMIQAICYAELGRIEEAINIVHLLADQPPVENDRRRVFPLAVSLTAEERRNEMKLSFPFNLVTKYSKGS